MKSWKLFLFLTYFVPFLAMAQISPLPVDQNTLGLWNFDNDIGDQVIDTGPSPLNGTAYTTELLAIPNIDPSFNLARRFSAQSSFVDLGVVQGSKLDFTGWNEVSVEAVIYLVQSASEDHIIFSSENVRLMVVNNQLAAFIRQPGGLFGVVSDRTLALNTTYRVGLHYKNQDLFLTINNRVDSHVKLDFGIQSPQFSNSRASIGGDLFARFLPGYIDDVRVRDIVGIDTQGPAIELIEPSSFQISTSRPNFLINLSDDESGVDVSSIEVYLNGILQPGITRNATQISGQLDDDMSTTLLNEVKVIVTDIQGNTNEKSFFFSYASIFDRQEYSTDSYTLALWHMNDFSPGFMKDDSGHGRNGYGNVTNVQIADGVFGQGRHFIRGGLVNFDSIRFDNLKFTLEAWLRPTSNNTNEEIIFYNGQVKIVRWNGGYVRVVLYTTKGEKSYQSTDVLLPVNELHHLAVSWDGTIPAQNIRFYVDGAVKGILDAVSDCDFDPIPKLGLIGSGYEGLIDEMRFSGTLRTTFSIPVIDNQVINYLTLKNGTSVNTPFPEFHATLNASATINVDSVKIKLNGLEEEATANLIVTPTGIDGVFSRPLQLGMNELEITFTDSQGNQRKKSQYFYYIKKNGGAEYSPEADTAGLWHFNEIATGKFTDDSGNGNSFVTTSFSPVPGVIGNAVRGSANFLDKMPLNCRSYTIEGYVKFNETYDGFQPLWQIGNASTSQIVRINTNNGNIQLNIVNTSTIDTEIPQAIPVDNAYHHIAVVYDGSRAYSQLLVIVDGVIKRSLDYHNSCDFSGNNNFHLGSSDFFSMDEFRVSKSAKYSFNVQTEVSDRPVITSSNASEKPTVHTSNFTLQFSVSDSDGINEDATKVFLNGVERPVSPTNGIVADFTSTMELINGANLITIKSRDMKSNEQVFTQTVYLFGQGSGEYVTDSDTVFLYHFNEVTGSFNDSASSGVNIDEAGWTRAAGVFGGSARNYSIGGQSNYGSVGNSGWSFEFWMKSNGYSSQQVFVNGPINIAFTNSTFQVGINGPTYSEVENTNPDNLWHHYAVVVDPSHTNDNVYLLKDGKVVYSTKTTNNLAIDNLSGGLGYTLYDSDIDEARFSKVPRYEFVSTAE